MHQTDLFGIPMTNFHDEANSIRLTYVPFIHKTHAFVAVQCNSNMYHVHNQQHKHRFAIRKKKNIAASQHPLPENVIS